MLQLRDGRKLIGILRSFDQFANVLLEKSVERIVVGNQYGDIELGVQVVRGENVVFMGRLDELCGEMPQGFEKVSEGEIKQAQKDAVLEEQLKGDIAKRFDFLDLE